MAIAALSASPTLAGSVTLAWDSSGEPDLAGFKIYRGLSPGTYSDTLTLTDPAQRTATIDGLPEGVDLYFAATAYDTSGNESGYSNEVVKRAAQDWDVPAMVTGLRFGEGA
jgi:hypothetical protein